MVGPAEWRPAFRALHILFVTTTKQISLIGTYNMLLWINRLSFRMVRLLSEIHFYFQNISENAFKQKLESYSKKLIYSDWSLNTTNFLGKKILEQTRMKFKNVRMLLTVTTILELAMPEKLPKAFQEKFTICTYLFHCLFLLRSMGKKNRSM